ncbi:5'/3'-nucleotidase SurE [Geoglobus acetivorans]|uniref:5'-nucleotidase SurE n=1 Tax=Geoglobus acetivorans TaxID=565033 RepID=A0A0A7GI02_GEOAI|nr:5-nucleotidase SurE [Geoglobus acetivorans]
MKILLTNDDGLYSPGLKASYRALSKFGEVYAVTPAVQKSGVGRSISIMEPIRVSEVRIDGIKIYAVDGTPTDAVIIGIHEIIGDVPDLTVSGINLGENLSTEAVTTSGTVGAALEAATQGSKAMAVSLEMRDAFKFESFFAPVDFSNASMVLEKLAKMVLEKGLPEGVDLLNVNVPERWNGRYRFTKLARRLYRTRIDVRFDPRGRKYFWIDGEEEEDAEDGTDLNAIRKGYVSITPLTLDMTSKIDFGELERWFDD